MHREGRRAALILLPAILGSIAPVFAQAPPAAPRERIEVTGTHIPRIAGETGLPVQAITREDIERSGIQTAQDLLDRISANMSYQGWSEALGVGGAYPGLTQPSLRGVGGQRTLVLLNGRRLAPYASTGGAGNDLSAIPGAAIERVEVLKDGASAVYGTDAIGGVINFILRRDFRGAEIGGNAYVTDQGGGDSRRANATFGYGDLERERFNALFTLDYLRQESLRAAAREFSRTAYLPHLGYDATSTFSWPANITQPRVLNPETGAVVRPGGFQGMRNPTVPATGATPGSCLPPYSFPTAATPLVCRFDYPSVIDSLPDAKKAHAFGRATWQATPELRTFVEGSYYKGEFIYRIAPTPVAGTAPLELAPGNPFYPRDFVASLPGGRTDLPVRLSWRTVELGPRTRDPETTQWRILAGVEGQAGRWSYEAGATYDTNEQVDSLAAGFVDSRLLLPLVQSGGYNPFAINAPEAVERLGATQFVGEVYRATSTSREIDARISGAAVELEAGPLDVAFGAAARRETLEQVSQPILQTNSIVGGGGEFPSQKESSRTVQTLFFEANAYLLRDFEVNLAVRMDRYSDFGATTNPKLTFRWQPRKDLMLRASGGSGFRAPTLSDLFLPAINGFTFNLYDDPVRCPVTGSELDCQAEFRTVGGGNEELEPEKSKQLNVGAVFEPAKGFSIGVDYYRVEIRDLITAVPEDAIFEDYERWGPTHIFRRAPDADNPGLPGRIDYVFAKAINGGTMSTAGFDVDLRARYAGAVGTVTLTLAGTYVLDYEVQEFETSVSGPGTGQNGAIPRWRHYLSIDWSSGPWGATLGQTYQHGYNEARRCDLFTGPPGTCEPYRRVGSLDIYDLQARYSGVKGLNLGFGVRNLFDRAPPLAITSNNSHQIGYDPSYTDPRGRTFYATARYVF
jgi:iron complex outermembrane receptor protein